MSDRLDARGRARRAGGPRASSLPCLAVLVLIAGGCDRNAATELPTAFAKRAEDRAAAIAQRYDVAAVPPEGLDLVTGFSKLRLHDLGPHRSLSFVGDDGTLALQTRMNLARPDELVVPYSKTMFASYLFQPHPARVLVVGVGGGSMIRFLELREPQLLIDAVDIDPEILAIADRYFATRPSERIRILAADGYEFIRQAGPAETAPVTYDVIYMDAFLRPSDETDGSGNPLRLKEAPFYAAIRARLSPQGVAAFNLNPQPERESDIDELRRSFPQVYVFDVELDENWVAIATQDPRRLSEAELRALAAQIGPRFDGALPFADMIDRLDPTLDGG